MECPSDGIRIYVYSGPEGEAFPDVYETRNSCTLDQRFQRRSVTLVVVDIGIVRALDRNFRIYKGLRATYLRRRH